MSTCERNLDKGKGTHNYIDGACIFCGKETPEIYPNEFKITLDEARSLLKLLEREFIPRDPYEDFENIQRVINGLDIFVTSFEK